MCGTGYCNITLVDSYLPLCSIIAIVLLVMDTVYVDILGGCKVCPFDCKLAERKTLILERETVA